MPASEMRRRRSARTDCFLLAALFMLFGCSPAPVPSSPTPPPLGSVLRGTPSPSPTPLPSATPTIPAWTLWTSSDENLALKKPVKVSRETWGNGGRAAVDGNPRTQWNSGAGPTQWIEIDLGAAYNLGRISLLPARYLPGVTVHTVLGKGPLTAGYETLYIFNSQVSDSPLLASALPGQWAGIRVVRIETSFSPVPVAWREIEIIGPQ